ncbi:TNFR-Cys domain-containing protein [Pycnococcus provasolii]
MRRATRGNVVAAIAVLAMAGVTWPELSLAETIVDVATFAQLKAAVHDKTSGPSTLRITNDIYYPTDGSVPSEGIRLKYAVRIVGACSSTSLVVSGTVAAGTCMLDAKEADRHFFYMKTAQYSTAEVVFEKLALVNGKKTVYNDDGGAVFASSTGEIRFEDVIFKDNTAPNGGGAVFASSSSGGKATFTSCRFIGNKASSNYGGAVRLYWESPSTFTLCTFQGNRALVGASGGHNVYVWGQSYGPSSASFYACTFLDLLTDSNHGVRKSTDYSSFTFYDNAPPLPPGMVLPPPPCWPSNPTEMCGAEALTPPLAACIGGVANEACCGALKDNIGADSDKSSSRCFCYDAIVEGAKTSLAGYNPAADLGTIIDTCNKDFGANVPYAGGTSSSSTCECAAPASALPPAPRLPPPLAPAPPGAAYVTSFSDLKTILHNQASGPSMIYVTQDIYYPTDGSVPSEGIRLKYAVRIVGACSSTSLVISGTVSAGTCMLDAKEVDRHFVVKTAKRSTAEVVFERLALVNGKKTGNLDDGGAVNAYATGATTRFEDVIFKDNTAPDEGGAVYADESGKATFTSCRFIGNKAYNAGGAVYLSVGSSLTFTLCTFKGNRELVGASGGHDVRVFGVSSSPSSASFYACTFLDYLDDSNQGVRKIGDDSSFTFYDNAPPLPPGMVLSPPPPPPPPSPPSPPPPVTYSYTTGSWSSCSASCGGGTQTRSVACKRSDGQSVSDSYCSESLPSTSQSCNTQACATTTTTTNAPAPAPTPSTAAPTTTLAPTTPAVPTTTTTTTTTASAVSVTTTASPPSSAEKRSVETSVQLVGLNKASFDAAAQQKFQRGVADTLGESVSATDVEILTVNEVPMASGRRLLQQTSPTGSSSALDINFRVNGFESQQEANAAAESLESKVKDGSFVGNLKSLGIHVISVNLITKVNVSIIDPGGNPSTGASSPTPSSPAGGDGGGGSDNTMSVVGGAVGASLAILLSVVAYKICRRDLRKLSQEREKRASVSKVAPGPSSNQVDIVEDGNDVEGAVGHLSSSTKPTTGVVMGVPAADAPPAANSSDITGAQKTDSKMLRRKSFRTDIPLAEWNNENVAHFIASLDMDPTNFEQNSVQGSDLIELDEATLVGDLGLKPFQAKKLVKEVAKMGARFPPPSNDQTHGTAAPSTLESHTLASPAQSADLEPAVVVESPPPPPAPSAPADEDVVQQQQGPPASIPPAPSQEEKLAPMDEEKAVWPPPPPPENFFSEQPPARAAPPPIQEGVAAQVEHDQAATEQEQEEEAVLREVEEGMVPSPAGDAVTAIIETARLDDKYLQPLLDLGVAIASDLKDVVEEDLDSMGMTKLEKRRFLAAVAEL